MSPSQRALISEAVGREVLHAAALTLGAAGIPVMPLKGIWLQAFAYGQPGERAVSDVDVLVQERDYARALALLGAAGWRARSWNVSEAALEHPRWSLPLDLHQRLFARAVFCLSTQAVFARGALDRARFGVEVVLPDARDVLAHLIGHGLKSRRTAGDPELVRDLELLAQRCALDPRACALHLERAGMARAARYLLHGFPASAESFYPRLLAELAPDPVAQLLVRFARGCAAHRRSKLAAVPAVLLDRSLGASIGALLTRVADLPLDHSVSTGSRARGL